MNNLMIILLGLSIAAFTGFNDATWAIVIIGIISGALDWLILKTESHLEQIQSEIEPK